MGWLVVERRIPGMGGYAPKPDERNSASRFSHLAYFRHPFGRIKREL
jgi:hypothetical protein